MSGDDHTIEPFDEGGRGPRLPPSLVGVVLALLLLGFALTLGLQRTLSFDYGWHLMAGRWIAEHHSVPRIDVMSVAHEGRRWLDLHWSFQVALQALYSSGGHPAVTLGKAALVVALAALTLVTGWRRAHPAVAVAATAAMLVAAAPRLIVRPELASFVLLAASLALWDRFERRGDKAIYGVVGLQLLWVNLHGLFALGLAIALAHAVAEIGRGVLGAGLRHERLRRIAAVLALATASSVLNPNGLEAALFPLRQLGMLTHAASTASDGLVAEFMRSLDPRLDLPPLHTIAWLALAGTSGLAMLAARSRLRPVDPLLWGAFGFLALEANRNVAPFAVVAAPILVRYASLALKAHPQPAWLQRGAALALGCTLVLASVDVVRDRFYPRFAYPRETGLGLQEAWYPEGAARFLAAAALPGPIANAMRDGGHLLMELYPPQRILTDGRFAGLGGERRFEIRGIDDLELLDREFEFGSVVVAYAALPLEGFVRSLLADPARRVWKAVFVDDVSLVFVRREGPGRQLPELDLERELAANPVSDHPAAARRQLRARSKLLGALDRPGRALDALDAARALAPVLREPSGRRAELLVRSRRVAEARAELDALLDSTREAWVATSAANLFLQLGDLRAARSALERALELDADYAPALERIAPVELAMERERARDVSGARAHQRVALAATRPRPGLGEPSRLRIWFEDGLALASGALLAVAASRRNRRSPRTGASAERSG